MNSTTTDFKGIDTTRLNIGRHTMTKLTQTKVLNTFDLIENKVRNFGRRISSNNQIAVRPVAIVAELCDQTLGKTAVPRTLQEFMKAEKISLGTTTSAMVLIQLLLTRFGVYVSDEKIQDALKKAPFSFGSWTERVDFRTFLYALDFGGQNPNKVPMIQVIAKLVNIITGQIFVYGASTYQAYHTGLIITDLAFETFTDIEDVDVKKRFDTVILVQRNDGSYFVMAQYEATILDLPYGVEATSAERLPILVNKKSDFNKAAGNAVEQVVSTTPIEDFDFFKVMDGMTKGINWVVKSAVSKQIATINNSQEPLAVIEASEATIDETHQTVATTVGKATPVTTH